MRSRSITLLIALCSAGLVSLASGAERGPLVLETKIPLIRRLEGFDEPQGVAFSAQTETLYVASGGDGVLSAFRGTQLEAVGKLDLGGDADNIRIDRDQGRIYVGAGSGTLSIIDATPFKRVGGIELQAHPESFQLEAEGSRIYVNVPDAKEVAVLDRKTNKQIASWPTGSWSSNYPMALDSTRNRVIVAFRQPATLVAFDAGSGAVQDRIDRVAECMRLAWPA